MQPRPPSQVAYQHSASPVLLSGCMQTGPGMFNGMHWGLAPQLLSGSLYWGSCGFCRTHEGRPSAAVPLACRRSQAGSKECNVGRLLCCCPVKWRRGPDKLSTLCWRQPALHASGAIYNNQSDQCSGTHVCMQLVMGRLTTLGLAPLPAHLWCCSIWLRHQSGGRLCCGGGGSSVAALKCCSEGTTG